MIAILTITRSKVNHGENATWYKAVTLRDTARIGAAENTAAINAAVGPNETLQSVDYPKQAITVRQPWAWAIMEAGKDVENRSRRLCPPGWYFVHAGLGGDIDEYNAALVAMGFPHIRNAPKFDELKKGGVVGVMKLGEWIEASPSPWFIGPKAARILAVVALPFQAGRGSQGVFPWDQEKAFDCHHQAVV